MSGAVSIPVLAPGVKLRFDAVRDAWVLLAPERLFIPDVHALAILKLVDGRRSIDDICSLRAEQYDKLAQVIGAEVETMLRALDEKGVVRI
ncbi:pyrroloquinoline quinone biosynthesis peptide chaperone PqqD [Burkholderia anthina]|uniref:pyrroloquinoline quinone biosynthesis peptide chaperone PqqD n=1 Tax=Burkholderia anthina TaxID=179879 RepID=UPI00158B7108|nr:pyrroloquinoline quinone biosynthesis peptide chaperone PqqD [Burkholderia anthina]